MKIVRVIGGLGNQLFQFAFYLLVKKTSGSDLVKLDISRFDHYELHDGYELERIFSVGADYCSINEKIQVSSDGLSFLLNLKRQLLRHKRSEFVEKKEDEYSFLESASTLDSPMYYKGYWQSSGYLDPVKDELHRLINFPAMDGEKNIEALQLAQSTESVSIHIRRGDYIVHPELGGVCDKAYYERAIDLIKCHVKLPQFLVFSNDIEWVQENFNFSNAKYVSWNSGEYSYRDMQLMTQCKNNIIANSSFSFWGAFLNKNEEKIVIAPKHWTQSGTNTSNICPKSWHLV